MSGITASASTYPLDFVRGRISGKLQTPDYAAGMHYKGVWQTIRLTIRHEGFFALYKGITPTLIGAIPYEGIKFGTVGICEKLFPAEPNEDKKQKVLRKLMFGGLGGIMAGTYDEINIFCKRLSYVMVFRDRLNYIPK